jgi:hypothetical protein
MLATKENPPEGNPAGFDDALAVGSVLGNSDGLAVDAAGEVSAPPAPPYPTTTKSGGFRFELDIERMHQSDTWAIAESCQRPFLVMLWVESWTQVPAGSLPDNDAVIAARIGMRLPEFKTSKDVLMRGWWKAEDGRLYHPVITEQVLDMVRRKGRKAANQAAYRERQRLHGTDADVTGHSPVIDRTTTTTTTKEIDQEQLSSAAPLTRGQNSARANEQEHRPSPAARGARLATVTHDAIETFNASPLTKANGGLVPNVEPNVGGDKRRAQVAKSLKVARDICLKDFDSELIPRAFWIEYWELCFEDEHKSGRAGGGKDHANWVPTFEYLTREATMLEIYDKAASAGAPK